MIKVIALCALLSACASVIILESEGGSNATKCTRYQSEDKQEKESTEKTL